MDDIIERVAKALCDDTLKRWRSPIALQHEPWREFIPAARAAIEAMREPSDVMTEVGNEAADWTCNADRVWQVMIDTALKSSV